MEIEQASLLWIPFLHIPSIKEEALMAHARALELVLNLRVENVIIDVTEDVPETLSF